MIALFLAVLVAQASPTSAPSAAPSPVPTLSPPWVRLLPSGRYDYVHYARREQDGTNSDISASRQVCDCQPTVALSMVQVTLGQLQGVSIRRGTITICGQPAQRLIATGLVSPGKPARNIEAILFRREPALYTLTYTFHSATPMPDAENALAALCP